MEGTWPGRPGAVLHGAVMHGAVMHWAALRGAVLPGSQVPAGGGVPRVVRNPGAHLVASATGVGSVQVRITGHPEVRERCTSHAPIIVGEPGRSHAANGRYYHQKCTHSVTRPPDVAIFTKGDDAVSSVPTPRTVRAAGVLTSLQGIVGLAFTVALLVRSTAGDLGRVGTLQRGETFGEAGYYAVLGLAVLAIGAGLWFGKHWARTPALLLQLLLLGAAWYAIGPSGRIAVGLVIAVPAVIVVWLLFNREGRKWSFYASEAPDAESADSP